MANTQAQPNQYKNISIKVNNIEISSLLYTLDIYQDIFTPVPSAELVILDSMNIQQNNNVIAGKTINIVLESDIPIKGKFKVEMVIYSISDKLLIKKGLYGYKIHLCTPQQFIDIKSRVSKFYSQLTTFNIVTDIININKLGKVSSNIINHINYDIIIPNMSPFIAIEWLSKFTLNNDNIADYVFYFNDGEFKFNSFSEMFNQDKSIEFYHRETGYRDNDQKEDEQSFYRIQKYNIIRQVDILRNLSTGQIGNTLINVDNINKTIKVDNYKNTIKSITYDDEILKNGENSVVAINLIHDNLSKGRTTINTTSPLWKSNRKINQFMFDSNLIMIDVAGNVNINKLLGKICKVNFPTNDEQKNTINDDIFKGKFLMSAIKHHITQNEYKNVVELCKR